MGIVLAWIHILVKNILKKGDIMVKTQQKSERFLSAQKSKGFLTGQKILVTDDSAFMSLIIKKLLGEKGYWDTIDATSGREAIDLYEKHKPDLVLLDIIMPGIDGLNALKKIMEIDKKAKVIMITAVGQEEIMKECRKIGAVGYIIKPFKEKQVLETIKKIIGPGKGQKQKIL